MTDKRTINFVLDDEKKSGIRKPSVLFIPALVIFAIIVISAVVLSSSGIFQRKGPDAVEEVLSGDSAGDAMDALRYVSLTTHDANLADREDTLRLIRAELLPAGNVLLWSLIDNDLSVTMIVDAAQDAESLISRLPSDPMVSSAAVTASAETNGYVMVNLAISLTTTFPDGGKMIALSTEGISEQSALRSVLINNVDHTMNLVKELPTDEALLREYALQFTVSDLPELEAIISRIPEGDTPCIIRDIRADSSEDDTINVNMTVVFYEPPTNTATQG